MGLQDKDVQMVKCKKCDVELFTSTNSNKMMCPKCRGVTTLEVETTQETCDICGSDMSVSSSGDTLLCKSCGQMTPYTKDNPINAPEIEYPSLMQQASNFVGAMGDYIKSGMKNIDDDKYNKRLEICASCPAFDASQGRCKECGCFMKVKAKMEAAKCPLNKWEE
jgi:hypothetical protein